MATLNRNKRLTVRLNFDEIIFGHSERRNSVLPPLN